MGGGTCYYFCCTVSHFFLRGVIFLFFDGWFLLVGFLCFCFKLFKMTLVHFLGGSVVFLFFWEPPQGGEVTFVLVTLDVL